MTFLGFTIKIGMHSIEYSLRFTPYFAKPISTVVLISTTEHKQMRFLYGMVRCLYVMVEGPDRLLDSIDIMGGSDSMDEH